MYLVAYNSRSDGTEEDIRASYEKHGLRLTSWARSGRTVNLIARPRSKISSLMSSRCCCIDVNPGGWLKRMRKSWMCSCFSKSLHLILKIYWPMRITHEEIRIRAGTEPISKRASSEEKMDVVRSRPQNGSPVTSSNCSHMGTRRQKKSVSSAKDCVHLCFNLPFGQGFKLEN